MRTLLICAVSVGAAFAADKPKVFITESQAVKQISGDVALNVLRGSSPQSIEVMKKFQELCPGVSVTNSAEKADFTVRLDHEAPSPVTPFTKGNKVAVFDRQEDLVYSNSTRTLAPVVKGACAAMLKRGK